MARVAQNNFTAGKFGRKMKGRFDVEQYKAGCQQLENFLVMPQGGAENMAGTEYIAEAKFSDKKSRIVKFEFSTTTTFAIEMGEEYFRFYSGAQRLSIDISDTTAWATSTAYVKGDYINTGGVVYYCLVDHTSGIFVTDLSNNYWVAQTIYEVPHPYQEADLFQVQIVQTSDVMYFFHPDYAVRKITRNASTDWDFETVIFDKPPLLDQNITDTTITPSAPTGNISLVASDPVFDKDHEGSYWELKYPRTDNVIDQAFTTATSTSAIPVDGPWSFFTTGSWVGTVKLQRSFDGVNWDDYQQFTSSAPGSNFSTSGTEALEGVQYRLQMSTYVSGTCQAVLQVEEFFSVGLVRIDTVLTTLGNKVANANATVIDTLPQTDATELWSEGAWSDHNGYPRAATLYQQRLVAAGTTREPQTIRASKTNSFEDFELGIAATDSLSLTLGAKQRNIIEWIESHRVLVFGTTADEYILFPPQGNALTPTNFEFSRQSGFGSTNIEARLINEVVFFIQRKSRKVRQIASYSFNDEQFVVPDITILSDDITEGGIVDTAIMQAPNSIYWAVTGEGKLIGLTYEKAENISAWHEHTTDGEYESVASIYGDGDDDLWVSVKRTINGSTKRYIELFKKRDDVTDVDNPQNFFFVHSGKTYDQGGTEAISGATQAEPVVITSTGHTRANNELVRIRMTDGMTELDGNVYTVKNVTANTFELFGEDGLTPLDGTAFSAYTSGGTHQENIVTLTGLDHLEGKSLAVLGDGAVQDEQVVSSGQITLTDPVNVAQVGLPYESVISPMPFTLGFQDGHTATRKAYINKCTARVLDTVGGIVGQVEDSNNTNFDQLNTRPIDANQDQGTTPFTGDVEVYFNSTYSKQQDVIIKQTQPLPMTVLAIMPEISYNK